jgi:hypothetical protein
MNMSKDKPRLHALISAISSRFWDDRKLIWLARVKRIKIYCLRGWEMSGYEVQELYRGGAEFYDG